MMYSTATRFTRLWSRDGLSCLMSCMACSVSNTSALMYKLAAAAPAATGPLGMNARIETSALAAEPCSERLIMLEYEAALHAGWT